jgi:hypothetical protein
MRLVAAFKIEKRTITVGGYPVHYLLNLKVDC